MTQPPRVQRVRAQAPGVHPDEYRQNGTQLILVEGMVGDARSRDNRSSRQRPGCFFILIALFPALMFWGLDGFYLGQERLFRQLHEDVVAGKTEAFLMDPSGYDEGFTGWLESVRSRSVFPFHLSIVLTVLLIILALLLVG